MVDFGKLPKGTIGDARRGLIVRFGKKEGQYPCKGSKSVFGGVKGLSEVRRDIRPHSGGCRFSFRPTAQPFLRFLDSVKKLLSAVTKILNVP